MNNIRYAKAARERLSFGISGVPGLWARSQWWFVGIALAANVFLVGAWNAGPQGDASMGLAGVANAKIRTAGDDSLPEFRRVPGAELKEISKAERAADKVSKRFRIAGEAALAITADVWEVSTRKNIDPLTILAIIGAESGFNPLAESGVGAQGLGQVLGKYHPEKIARVRAKDGHILSVKDNIEELTNVYADCLKRFNGDEVKALQYYNGSLNDKSRKYSNRVLSLKKHLSA